MFAVTEEHERHLRHERQGEHKRDEEPVALSRPQGDLARLFLCAAVVAVRVRREPCLLDGGEDVGKGHVPGPIVHLRRFGGEIDGRLLDAIDPAQDFFQTGGTGSAGHAFDRQFQMRVRHLKTRFANAVDNLVTVRLAAIDADARALGGKIDLSVHARQSVENTLDTRSAGSAGHAFNGQIQLLRCSGQGLGCVHDELRTVQ